ncbi:MAG: cupin domain-containing protein [Spirochaetia bacterium]|nr:cupin domain-containing protein [Spirochaetia bacterium]
MESCYKISHSESILSSDIKLFGFLKELLLKDYKIYEMTQVGGDLIPYHAHSHEEILIIIEGGMRVIVEEDIINLKEGDMITIKSWAVHLSCFPFVEETKFYLCHPMKKKPESKSI